MMKWMESKNIAHLKKKYNKYTNVCKNEWEGGRVGVDWQR